MKKLILVLIALALLGSSAVAEIDLKGMSYDELVELRSQVDAALWASEEWNEVEVPAGVYIIGEDIPAGHYTVSYYGKSNLAPFRLWRDKAAFNENEFGTVVEEYFSNGDSINVIMDDGQCLEIHGTENVFVFTPYTGSNLGFK